MHTSTAVLAARTGGTGEDMHSSMRWAPIALLALTAACSSSDRWGGNPPKTLGAEPGGPFIVQFADGFDPETQYISDFGIHESWMDAYFDPANVRYEDGGVSLVIEKRAQHGEPYTGGEFQQLGFYGYGRYETVMRGAPGVGVVAAFFTHTHSQFNGDPHDEIDFEYMGQNTRQLHLNHFKDGKAAGSTYIDLPFDYTEGEHLYAFEWEPDTIRWYVDGELVYETFDMIPDHSGRVIISILAVGEASYGWAGKPTFDTPRAAFYRCISHVPLGQSGAQCSDTFEAD